MAVCNCSSKHLHCPVMCKDYARKKIPNTYLHRLCVKKHVALAKKIAPTCTHRFCPHQKNTIGRSRADYSICPSVPLCLKLIYSILETTVSQTPVTPKREERPFITRVPLRKLYSAKKFYLKASRFPIRLPRPKTGQANASDISVQFEKCINACSIL